MPNRGRGRGRGRVNAKIKPTELFPPSEPPPPPLAIPGPSSRTYEEEKSLVIKSLSETKKRIRALTPVARNIYVGKKRQKQLERFLLPDAPPRKQKRKQSPNRSECRLICGTPETPPARKLMPWEMIENQTALGTSGTAPEKTPPHMTAYEWDTPTSAISFNSEVEVPGFSPLHIDWSTGNLRRKAQTKTPSLPLASSSSTLIAIKQIPKPKKGPNNISNPIEKVISGSDYGTKKAEKIFGDWLEKLEAESDKDDDHDDKNDLSTESVDINLDAAISPPNMEDGVKEWLQNEDAEADRTLRGMLPLDHLTFDWSCDHKTFTGQREVFTASPGPTFRMDKDTTPLTVFRKFFDDDLLDIIVTQTNKYASVLIDKNTAINSRMLKWKNTDRNEIVIFLAIIILQGLAPLNVEADYWQENGYLTLKYFKDLMIYERFILMKRVLHFANNNVDLTGLSPAQRKVRKIWPVLDHLNKKFSELYIPRQNIAIDESLLKWHGRLSFAQKIATKAAKVGIKNYELCESETGYMWSFFIYTGKGEKIGANMTNENGQPDITEDLIDLTNNDINDVTDDIMDMTNNDENHHMTDSQPTTTSASSSPPPPQNATAQIVQVLAKPLLGKGYTLVMDNFYNSPLLARYLKAQKTDCFGTLRANRELVPEAIKGLAKTELRVGEIVQTFSRDMVIMLWRDTNVVSMLSTFHGGQISGKEKYGRYKYKPQIVLDYNLAMGGVDKKDQLLSAHPMERTRNQAWYKKVFRRLFNVTINNAFVIFKTLNSSVTSRAFRQRLADEMIMTCKPPQIQTTLLVTTKSIIQYPGGQSRPILKGNHFIGQGMSKYTRCVWCREARTKYICKQCNMALCIETCFEEYHTKTSL